MTVKEVGSGRLRPVRFGDEKPNTAILVRSKSDELSRVICFLPTPTCVYYHHSKIFCFKYSVSK